jgi:hypothetical protein
MSSSIEDRKFKTTTVDASTQRTIQTIKERKLQAIFEKHLLE